ncbi:O-antigen ligase family protein [Megasphaera stantonii]|uniref:O-antigen ligase family protein n=1 Tax=Megasphaera stantonii TaxID=2144175 RepID=UPI0023F1EBE8|nr:O-antigen ligase family protein [Megasphaera stantonii]
MNNLWSSISLKKEYIEKGIVFLIVFFLSGNISNAPISISMGLGGAYIIYDCIRNRSLKRFFCPLKIWLGLGIFLGTVLLASILLFDISSIRIAVKYVYWSLPFILIIYFSKQVDTKYAAIWGVAFSIFITSIYSFYLYFSLPYDAALPYGRRIGGFAANPNFYAVLLVETLPILILSIWDERIKKSKVCIAVFAVIGILGVGALLLTGSRGGILGFTGAFIITLFVFCAFKKRIKMFILIAMVVLGGILVIANIGLAGGTVRSYDMERVYLLKSSIEMWTDHKIIGVGLDNWADEYQQHYIQPEAKETNLVIPHNTIAWFFSSTGIIGGIGYLFYVIYVLYIMLMYIKKYGMNYYILAGIWLWLGVNLHGMVDVGITMKGSARLAALGIGLMMAEILKQEAFTKKDRIYTCLKGVDGRK